MQATRELLLTVGPVDFTLRQVSELSGVSIGGIYFRFLSRDSLLQAAVQAFLEELLDTEKQMLLGLTRSSDTLEEFLPRYISSYRTILQDYHPLISRLLPTMSVDSEVGSIGKKTAIEAEFAACAAIAQYVAAAESGDLSLKINSVYQMIFSHLIRDVTYDVHLPEEVRELRQRQLAAMCLVYLRS